ncbi:MAG: hypothetical protein AAF587_11130 [Bacteroidota bacterium]
MLQIRKQVFWTVIIGIVFWLQATDPSPTSHRRLDIGDFQCPGAEYGGDVYGIVDVFPFSRLSRYSNGLDSPEDAWGISLDTSFLVDATYHHSGRQIHSFHIEAHLAYFTNNTDKPWGIGYYRGCLPIHQEAIDPNGEWRAIEAERYMGCSSDADDIVLAPGEYLITKVPVYDGTYQTRIRLVWEMGDKKVVSNSYLGRIHPGQFNPKSP